MEKFEDIFVNNNIVFDNVYKDEETYHKYTDCLIELSNEIKNRISTNENRFCEMCYYLTQLKDCFTKHTLFSINGKFVDFYGYCENAFGMAKTTVCNYIKVYAKFCCSAGGTIRLTSAYDGFTVSKLCELLAVSDKQLLNDLKENKLVYTMTKKDIREYVKSLKKQDKANKVLEENTPIDVAYNKNIHYTADFFKDFSKEQLIDFILSIQTEYEQIKSKKQKVKK